MNHFIQRNNLYLITALAAIVAVIVAWNWTSMPVLQRMVGLFFVALVMHLWEEQRIPGGFVEMVTEHLHFTASSREFGETVTAAVVLVIAFVPLLFPRVAFLAMAPMMLGVLEAVEHVGVIKVFRLKHFYSPGMVTAVGLLLPISVYSIVYAVRNDLIQPPALWLLSFLYMFCTFIIGQQIVVRSSGVKYSDFLKNVRAAFSKASA
jgi:hypothetical protein